MDSSLIIKLIEKKKWVPYKKSGVWIHFSCPFAKKNHLQGTDEKPSFGICTEGSGRYFCFTCGSKGSLRELFSDLPLSLCLLDGPQKENIKKDVVYPESYLEEYIRAYNHPYLNKRGVLNKIREQLDFRYDWRYHRVCVPIRNFEKQLVGLVGRSLISSPKYYVYPWNGQSNGQCWLGEHWVDLSKPLILCEGLFDVCKVLEVYSNVLGSLMVTLNTKKLERIKSCPYIVTLFDNDSTEKIIAGNLARKTVEQYFGKKKVTHIIPPEPYKDVGEMTKEVIQELLHKKLLILC